jgi:hypothetical protein
MLCKSVQIILDVPTVGGRLMLVDMAGSENIEQAGQIGFEAKMQVRFVNTYLFVSSVCMLFIFYFCIFLCIDLKGVPC